MLRKEIELLRIGVDEIDGDLIYAGINSRLELRDDHFRGSEKIYGAISSKGL